MKNVYEFMMRQNMLECTPDAWRGADDLFTDRELQ